MKLPLMIGLNLATGTLFFLLVRNAVRVDKSLATYFGPIEDYPEGGKRLIVVFTASWAPGWKRAQAELRKLDFDRFDLCILDRAVDYPEIKRQRVEWLPTVALVERGKVTLRLSKFISLEQMRDW